MANGERVVPLGLLEIKVDGLRVRAVVMNSLCNSFIVGKDLMRCKDSFLLKLISAIKGCDGEQARGYCAAVEGQVFTASVVTAKSTHCEFLPIEFEWKDSAKAQLKCNVKAALREAGQLALRLRKKGSVLFESYGEILRNWADQGWLKEIPPINARYCLRHFPVIRDPLGKTAMARCRVVVEGSALTNLLNVEPCSHKDIVKNLLLWRSAHRFVAADISQAYMRVQVSETDQPYLCIAWMGRVFQFTSLPMGVSPSAAALQRVVNAFIAEWEGAYNLREGDVEICKRIVPYMDDLLLLLWEVHGQTVDSAQWSRIEGEAGRSMIHFFSLKGLACSPEKTWDDSAQKASALGIPFRSGLIGAATGKLAKLVEADTDWITMSRRKAMSILSALFDPRGLIVEIAISARVLASSLSGLAWDAAIPRSLAMEVGKWARTAVEVARDLQPRFVRPIDGKIFVFVDASTTAHGTCVVVEDGNGELRRLYANGSLYKKHNKSWVSVSSKIELLALKQGVLVGRYLKEMFEGIPGWSQAEMIFGTDNETNFNRIASGTFEQIGERWERFNAVEVNNIMVKLGATIFHVPGSSNPADSVSRGVWEAGSSKMREAVNWFNRERAAVPRKFVLARVTACEARVAAVQRTSDQVMMEEIRESESLTERYMREGQGKSRSEWILSYQERDGACMELVYSKRAVMINGVWTFPHRQALDASVLPAVIVPKELIKNALVTLHERGGHLGARKAAARGRDTFWWRKMGLDLKRHVMTCPVCQSLNGTPLWKSAPGRLYAEGRSWSVVGIDFVKGMDKPILTVTCLYTRYLYAFPLSNEKASTVCETLRKLFCVEGAPSMIVSDNAQNFTSEELAAFLKKWNVVLRFIPRYSPWYGGGYEAGHRTLMKTLAAVVSGCSTDWKKQLAEATFYYNCRPYELAEDTALSPQEVFRGRRMINPWRSATMETDDPWPSSEIVAANIPELLAERDRIAMDFEETWKRMRTASMEEIRRRSKRVESFEVGEAVYVWIPPLLREGK